MNRGPVNAETTTSPNLGQSRWCPDCRKRAGIEDVFEDSMWNTRGEVAFTVTALDCGHALHSSGVVVMGYRSAADPVPAMSASDPWA